MVKQGRPKLPRGAKRSEKLMATFTPEEAKKVRAAAAASDDGPTVSDWLRAVALRELGS